MSNRRKTPRLPDVRLPVLRPFDGGELEPDGDYDGVEFAGLDLTRQDGAGARFLDCALRGVVLDDARLTAARFIDSALEGVRGTGTDLADATLRDVEVTDARLGGVQLHGAVFERVVIRGGKSEFLNLHGAQLTDVVFEDCVLVEPNFQEAKLTRVAFPGSSVRGADLSQAVLADVDLRGARELSVGRGLDRMRGAVISPEQLFDLAPAFAAQAGVEVRAV
ncbi:hypothetical protein SRB5_32120 [Streptomyces sp. RB5]|uniref:Pentapeptide repeat-containing protein n=1 Tax=Streptomyces smaragdinus TaxID=2585196 RepID=A0A7K0CJ70_9ACTN|nr:pentapeptide repeat-containing protein [Streptomyces smaragdinus]MQY13072.1 hypothetical protein [Streptomyces smaragdinus]